MFLRQSLSLAALTLGLSAVPALASVCTDPDPAVDLVQRVTDCTDDLNRVYDRAAYAHLVFNLGRALRLQGNTGEALPVLTEVLSHDPESALYWAELARLYMATQEPGTAAAMFSQALVYEPANPWLIGDRAEAWANLGRPQACLDDLAAAIPGMGDDKDVPWYLNLQGRCHASAGDPAAALTAYDAAVKLMPGYADAQGNRLYALAALGRNDQLLADSATLLGAGSPAQLSDDWIISLRGLRLDALVLLGQTEAVDAEIAALRAAFPGNNLPVANLAAWALFTSGRLDEAATAVAPLRAAYDDGSVQGYMLDTLAQIDLAYDRREEALKAFRDAAWLQPSLSTAWVAPLVAQGYLPLDKSADSILATLTRCIEERGASCDLKPAPAVEATTVIAAVRPAAPPSGGLGTGPGGAPAFAPAPGDAAPVPASPAPVPATPDEAEPPRLGTAPAPVAP